MVSIPSNGSYHIVMTHDGKAQHLAFMSKTGHPDYKLVSLWVIDNYTSSDTHSCFVGYQKYDLMSADL